MAEAIGVVIVGAGPNGLMLACELGLAGMRSVVVLDPQPGPNPAPRANRVVGEAARILDHRGLYSVLTGTSEPPKPAPRSMFAGFQLDLSSIQDSQLFVVPIQQQQLVEVLTHRAAGYGAAIRWGHTLTGFDQHADCVAVHVSGPNGVYQLTAEYLVGADGGTSTTRHLAGIDFPGMSSYDLVMRMGFNLAPPDDWIQSVGGAIDMPNLTALPPLQFHRTAQGVFAWGAMGSRVVAMTYELAATAHEQRDGEPSDEPPMTVADLEASVQRVLGADVPLLPVTADAPMDLRRFAGINSRIASQYQLGRVILVGDAAHVHSPIGGPGLNLSMQDAVNLGWKLAVVLHRRVHSSLLDTYQQERRAAAERVIMQSRSQLALFRPGPEVTALRELFSELVTEPAVVRRLGDLLSGADNRYPMGANMHALAGHWVPDFAVSNTGGIQRIAEFARAGRPVLVDLTGSGSYAAALSDLDEQLTVATGILVGDVPATAMLVRPDGYVAWASSQASPTADELRDVRTVLRQWFGI
ncbi:polyketide oxidase [Mycobacterium sp. CBMA293]|uniref:FAD-dependent monooxygenase n=1 Tax=unclassified Mycolicibacterium TaxID=2636767 RepID=UPI0012DDEA0F|nr:MULTISPECIES: FAD-dependent monooxygenase [unclassified Mycolicibacterium]MUL46454.1 polyketide oxidase [Mycolicibacterium sp. CBMA 360]MUL57034.1 polyketide oxidase [Mycolicibacterium sp. CBMA 335]MUL70074.1 polyketide oxidase [Mycolicibacterium sp. CBMA 311]MUL92122.1 polyketide oxidase [Mycolicibacterium sp. CBMA 230]MUM05860.1 hypothetical protein [Mycolicibacterium sp. CBMA 213]